MASTAILLPKPFISYEEYLAMEFDEECPAEYIDGVVYEFVATTPTHAQISANLNFDLIPLLRPKGCILYGQNVAIFAGNPPVQCFPDAAVVCGKPAYRDGRRSLLINPRTIFEILSPSTEGRDRGPKFRRFKRLDSLQEYVLISQDGPTVEVLRRSENGFWLHKEFSGLDAIVPLLSLDISLPIAGLYHGVEFGEAV